MKNLYFILFLFLGSICQAQIVNIPDFNFKSVLMQVDCAQLVGNDYYSDVDTNNDGEIQVSEAEAVINLSLIDRNIFSLEGIQSFTNLEQLWCWNNEIATLDLSNSPNLVNLKCFSNQLSSLNVSQNKNLELLDCYANELTSLDVSNSPNLRELNCSQNRITSLDVTQNSNLVEFLPWGNRLTSLDITQNPNLEFFGCGSNQLTSLDVTLMPNMTYFSCDHNELTSLDITQMPNLETLRCYNNQITSLDFTQNPNLHSVLCEVNQLTSVDLRQNPKLALFTSRGNQFTSIDVSQNPLLEIFDCRSNELTTIDVSQNHILRNFNCGWNQLTSLNIKNGNNDHPMFRLFTRGNPDLLCITVDDVVLANSKNCDEDQYKWCKDDVTVYNEACDFVIEEEEDLSQTSIILYPNPIEDTLHIDTQLPISLVRIFSIDGSLVKETSGNSISVIDLPTGIYFARIKVGGDSVSKKFVKL